MNNNTETGWRSSWSLKRHYGTIVRWPFDKAETMRVETVCGQSLDMTKPPEAATSVCKRCEKIALAAEAESVRQARSVGSEATLQNNNETP